MIFSKIGGLKLIHIWQEMVSSCGTASLKVRGGLKFLVPKAIDFQMMIGCY